MSEATVDGLGTLGLLALLLISWWFYDYKGLRLRDFFRRRK